MHPKCAFGETLFATTLRSIGRIMPIVLIAALVVSMSLMPTHAEDTGVALEVVAGKLKPGVSVGDHDKADKAVAEMISKLPGFISRETGAGPEGEWFAIVHWASLKDAENAAAVFMQSTEGKASMAMTDPSSILFKHYIVGK